MAYGTCAPRAKSRMELSNARFWRAVPWVQGSQPKASLLTPANTYVENWTQTSRDAWMLPKVGLRSIEAWLLLGPRVAGDDQRRDDVGEHVEVEPQIGGGREAPRQRRERDHADAHPRPHRELEPPVPAPEIETDGHR